MGGQGRDLRETQLTGRGRAQCPEDLTSHLSEDCRWKGGDLARAHCCYLTWTHRTELRGLHRGEGTRGQPRHLLR